MSLRVKDELAGRNFCISLKLNCPPAGDVFVSTFQVDDDQVLSRFLVSQDCVICRQKQTAVSEVFCGSFRLAASGGVKVLT